MADPRRILWIASDAPDHLETEIRDRLAALNELSVMADLDRAVAFVAGAAVDFVFANFPSLGVSAAELMEAIAGRGTSVPVLIRDADGTIEDGARLARLGAQRVFGREVGLEDVLDQVQAAGERCSFGPSGANRPHGAEPWRASFVGESPNLLQLIQLVRLVGKRRCTVLITGETGTGKEVLARAIHASGPRSSFPWVAVNCSAIPEALLEAELFGHVKGAFTGAQQHRIGRFEQAHEGTLFLDEIGDMPLELQSKLLRALQEREFQRLGSSETVRVNVRVIAASNASLSDKVRQGTFREDLYYRLSVVPIEMPPLRTRLSDVPLLAQHFIRRICADEGIEAKKLSREAREKLCHFSWPGNVRQLENALEMAIVLSGDRPILYPSDFTLAPVTGRQERMEMRGEVAVPDHGLDFAQTVNHFERSILTQALQKTGGNKKLAADMLRLKRTTLAAKVKIFEMAAGRALV